MSSPVLYIHSETSRLPSYDPFCLAVQAYLRLAGITGIKEETTQNVDISPSGTLPLLFDGEQWTAGDFFHIIHHLKKLRPEEDLDSRLQLSPAEVAEVRAFAALIEDKLHSALLYNWWMEDENYSSFSFPLLNKPYPFPLGRILASMERKKVRGALSSRRVGLQTESREERLFLLPDGRERVIPEVGVTLGRGKFGITDEACGEDVLHLESNARGVRGRWLGEQSAVVARAAGGEEEMVAGRVYKLQDGDVVHLLPGRALPCAIIMRTTSYNNVYADAAEAYRALSERLGSQRFFFGDYPSSLDAVAFGHLAVHYYLVPPTDSLATLISTHDNLVDYLGRILTSYFGDTRPAMSRVVGSSLFGTPVKSTPIGSPKKKAAPAHKPDTSAELTREEYKERFYTMAFVGAAAVCLVLYVGAARNSVYLG